MLIYTTLGVSQIIQLCQEKWHIGEKLGAGGFASVHLAQSEDGAPAVAKLIPKAPGADRELLFEDLKGVPNVVPMLDSGEWNNYLVIVMPKADKSLRDFWKESIEHLSMDDIVRVLTHITEALAAIEGRIVHRDIKPDNVLLLNGHWCLADFGISRYADATTASDTRKYAMSPPYAAPEQWHGETATSATDVYALGVTSYELLAGRRPFLGPDFRSQHLKDTPKPIRGIPAKLQSLINECLYKNPEARPRPKNLLERLREGMLPTSKATRRLQQANALVVEEKAEEGRRQSVAKSEAQRRHELCESAEQSLEHIVALLHNDIVASASQSKFSKGASSWSWSLKEAELRVEKGKMAKAPSSDTPYLPAFKVVAYSSITLRIPPDRSGYDGRSHSLWYCDAKDAGVFRWYETAFMFGPFIRRRKRFNPFLLEVGCDAYEALSPVIGEYQVAWPFTPIDQGDEGELIERWLGWFADAALGELRHPSHMPEREAQGSWRM